MDALALLREVSQRDGIDGRIAEALDDAEELIGKGVEDLDEALIQACSDAPEDLAQPCRYAIEAGGKRIRPVLCLLTYRSLGGNGPLPLDLAVACELLHNATLLHDDVIDEGDLRRGQPAPRVVYGNAISVLSGDYLLVKTVEIIAARGSRYIDLFLKTLRETVNGELMQLKRRGSVKTTEEEYFHIIEGKTASLFRFATRLGTLAADVPDELAHSVGEFGWHIGMAFQLTDDILDFSADASHLGKNLLADIREGKMTLPVIRAAKIAPELGPLLARLADGNEPTAIAGRIAEIVEETRVIEGVREKAAWYTVQAIQSITAEEELDSRAKAVLAQLANALLNRTF